MIGLLLIQGPDHGESWTSKAERSIDQSYIRLGLFGFALIVISVVGLDHFWLIGLVALIWDDILLNGLGQRIVVHRSTRAMTFAIVGNLVGGIGAAVLLAGLLFSNDVAVQITALIALTAVLVELADPKILKKVVPETWIYPLLAVLMFKLWSVLTSLGTHWFVSFVLISAALWVSMMIMRRIVNSNAPFRSVAVDGDQSTATNDDSKLVSFISHEIRTPMNALFGSAQLMRRDTADTQKTALHTTLSDAAMGLKSIVDNSLDYAELGENAQVPDKQLTDLRVLLNEVEAGFRPAAEEKNLSFHIADLPESLGSVSLQQNYVRKVLAALVSNAIKFTDDGEISITVSERQNDLVFTVTDTGVGIHESAKDLIFEPFEKIEKMGAKSAVGLGLGLTIGRMIADRLGGALTFESNPGQGSRFEFSLPLRETSEPVIAPQDVWKRSFDRAAFASERGRLDNSLILIVDDAPVNRFVLRSMVEREGATVVEAENGQQALEIIESTGCDAVLLDNAMPVMSGVEMLQMLRDSPGPRSHLPVIGISAGTVIEEVEQFKAVGLDAFLPKPVIMSTLIDQIEGLVKPAAHIQQRAAQPQNLR